MNKTQSIKKLITRDTSYNSTHSQCPRLQSWMQLDQEREIDDTYPLFINP